MYRIKIVSGTDLHKVEEEANSFLERLEDVEHANVSLFYCDPKQEYVLTLGIVTPDYLNIPFLGS